MQRVQGQESGVTYGSRVANHMYQQILQTVKLGIHLEAVAPLGAEHTGVSNVPLRASRCSVPAAGQHARSARIILPCRGCSNGLMYSHAPRSSLACFRAVTERRTLTEGAHQASPRCRARASAEPARSASTCALSRTFRTGSRSGDLGRLSSGITVTC